MDSFTRLYASIHVLLYCEQMVGFGIVVAFCHYTVLYHGRSSKRCGSIHKLVTADIQTIHAVCSSPESTSDLQPPVVKPPLADQNEANKVSILFFTSLIDAVIATQC